MSVFKPTDFVLSQTAMDVRTTSKNAIDKAHNNHGGQIIVLEY